MKAVTGKPQTLKQVNRSAVRKAIRERGSATRAEIAEITRISVTTVRTLLTELLEDGEIMVAGYDESIGGRKAVRYELVKDRFQGVVLCLDGDAVRYATVNICGEILESGTFPAQGDLTRASCVFLDELVTQVEVRSIGIGVPGIVNGMGFERINAQGEFEFFSIGETLRERYRLPVLLENDLNAITLGFGRCYLKEFPEEKCQDVHMAYIHFEKTCLSAGFLSGGRILRGWHNYVGELGLFPVDERRTLDDVLSGPLEDSAFARLVAKQIAGICCVLNPQYVALGGEAFRKECLPLVTEHFTGMLPDKMSAEIVYAENKWHDYFMGMAYLTAEQIFEDVLLVEGSR